MFFQTIRPEVKDLGDEIISYYEEIKKNTASSYGELYDLKFRGYNIVKFYKEYSPKVLDGFTDLNNREKKYIRRCITNAYLKKITFNRINEKQ